MNTSFAETVDREILRGPKPVVVGVDGSTNNLSAVEWAAQEAQRAEGPLRVLNVTEKIVSRSSFVHDADQPFGPAAHARAVVDRVADKVRRDHPNIEVTADVVAADTLTGLVNASREAAMVVVGKRGLGTFRRAILGSTSIALAGRSAAPTVIVPDEWNWAEHQTASILVGADLEHDNHATLDFAFARADEQHVPLVVMHVWDTHPAMIPSEDDRKRWARQAQSEVEAVVDPWMRKHPHVEVLPANRHAPIALGLLDSPEHAQLLVIGRQSSGRSMFGFGVGTVARTILHYADLPVAVVPGVDTL
jgi:nucleotide-binding universal stress UspA family protein